MEHNKTDEPQLTQDPLCPECTPATGKQDTPTTVCPEISRTSGQDAVPAPQTDSDIERETVDFAADVQHENTHSTSSMPGSAQVVEWLAPEDAPVPPELSELNDADVDPAFSKAWYHHLLSSLGKWLVMVLLFIVFALGASLFALYLSVDSSQLPAQSVHFGEQLIEPTAYRWQVPVAGPVHRTLKKREQKPITLDTVTLGHPDLDVPDDLESLLILRDEGDQVIFEGTPEEYQQFAFSENGLYHGELTLSQGLEQPAEKYEPVGSYTYDFTFQLEAQPLVRLSGGRQVGGSVVGIRVDGLLDENPPWLESELGEAVFVPLNGGWAAFLPISAVQPAGDYTVTVHAGDSVSTHPITVSYRQTQDLYTFSADGTALVPYLGAPPRQVTKLFNIADPEAYWVNDGFIQPLSGRTMRNYEVMEHIDNVVDPALLADPLLAPLIAEINRAAPSRHSLNVTMQTRPGTDILCPADGRVVFTGTVDGGGRCIVVEHGCGLKSVFYLLANYKVSEGDYVSQGTVLGTTQGHTICEVWLNDVPLNPWEVWGEYGGLFFH